MFTVELLIIYICPDLIFLPVWETLRILQELQTPNMDLRTRTDHQVGFLWLGGLGDGDGMGIAAGAGTGTGANAFGGSTAPFRSHNCTKSGGKIK